MKINFKITEADYQSYQLFQNTKVKSNRWLKWVIILIVLVLYTSIGIGLMRYTMEKNIAYILFGLGIFWIFVFPFYFAKKKRDRVRKLVRKKFSPFFNQEVKISLTELGIKVQDHTSEQNIAWPEVVLMEKLKKNIYLHTSSKGTLILPYSRFSKPQKTVQILIDHIPTSKINTYYEYE